MPWSHRRTAYIVLRNLGPPINVAIGICLGTQAWFAAGTLLLVYLVNMGACDVLFWRESDETHRVTRHKLEEHLGVRNGGR